MSRGAASISLLKLMEANMFLYKHPHTTNEKRQYAQTIYNELGLHIRVRGNRRPHMLPNAWDDIDRPQMRNWKYYRKTQWKEK